MEPNLGPQTPYEVHCYNCQTSFAVGTKQCVHCGGRIGRSPLRERVADASMRPAPGPIDAELAEEEESPAEMSIGRRLGGLAVWIVLVLGATVMRLCEGS